MEVVHQEEHQAGGEEAKEDIGDPEEPDRTEGIIIIHWENRSQRLRESNRDQVTVFSIGERDSFFPSQGERGTNLCPYRPGGVVILPSQALKLWRQNRWAWGMWKISSCWVFQGSFSICSLGGGGEEQGTM